MEKKRSELLETIRSAFEAVHRGDGVTLHQAQAMDDYAGPDQERDARRMDSDRRWGDVPDEEIAEHYNVLTFLDGGGFRYYLPAYMNFSVKYYQCGSFDLLVLDYILYALTPDDPELSEWRRDQFASLNRQQREAVCRFLEFMKEEAGEYLIAHDYAERALKRYWGRFCGRMV